jgi:hypothetical protein
VVSKLFVQVPSVSAARAHQYRAPRQMRRVRMMSECPMANRKGSVYGLSRFGICKEVERHQDNLSFISQKKRMFVVLRKPGSSHHAASSELGGGTKKKDVNS